MRFEDWDVILFPAGRDSKIPFKEFRVTCHVVSDTELSHIHGSTGTPIMTCFVPSLAAGAPFQVSIHNWRIPKVSRFAQDYSRHPELIKFEARILVDGHPVASTIFNRDVNGPHLIASTFDPSKTGDLQRLRFPCFHPELLYQSHWDPADEVGRVKIVITEGFPRDSSAVPIERVKSVVAFSFQHAPLEILKSNGIAWPSPALWQRTSQPNTSISVPTQRPQEGVNSHTHSPQRKETARGTSLDQGFQHPSLNRSLCPPHQSTGFWGDEHFPLPYLYDGNGLSLSSGGQWNESPAYGEWMSFPAETDLPSQCLNNEMAWQGMGRNGRKQLSSDTTMSDYIPEYGYDPMQVSNGSLDEDPMSQNLPNTSLGYPRASLIDSSLPLSSTFAFPSDFATSLTHSLLNQPLPIRLQSNCPDIRPSENVHHNENQFLNVGHSNPSSTRSTPLTTQIGTRTFPQRAFSFGAPFLPGPRHFLTDSRTESVCSDRSPGRSLRRPTNISQDTSMGYFERNLVNLNTGELCAPLHGLSNNLLQSYGAEKNAAEVRHGIEHKAEDENTMRRESYFSPVSVQVAGDNEV